MVNVILLLVLISLIWRHNNGSYPVLMGTHTTLTQIRLFQRYLFYFLPTVTTQSFLHWFLAISFLKYEYDQEKLPNCPTITEANDMMTSWNKTKIILRHSTINWHCIKCKAPCVASLGTSCVVSNAKRSYYSSLYTYIYTYTQINEYPT